MPSQASDYFLITDQDGKQYIVTRAQLQASSQQNNLTPPKAGLIGDAPEAATIQTYNRTKTSP
jgi:hypothetical protein